MELRLRDPKLRKHIWRFFSHKFLINENLLKKYDSTTPDHMILPNIFLTLLKSHGEEDYEEISKCIRTLRSGKMILFRDAEANKLLLQALMALSEQNNISAKDKKTLLTKALAYKIEKTDKPNKVNIIKALQSLATINLSGYLKNLDSVSQNDFLQFLSEIRAETFRKVIPIRHGIKDFTNKFDSTFGRFRNPDTIFIYASSLAKLLGKEDEKMLHELAACVEEIIEGKFPACRYEGSDHLEKFFSYNQELKTLWVKGAKKSFDKVEENDSHQEVSTKECCYIGWTIEDSDDACDLFLCGTEVLGSCQKINGDPKLNKCLLAYVRDGKNRLLAIKDQNGKIRARAILLLLWNDHANQPVLFLERIYPLLFFNDQLLGKALIQFAIERSKFLRVPILSKNIKTDNQCSGNIVSFGSPVPYEYFDAGHGINKNGKVTISGAYYL